MFLSGRTHYPISGVVSGFSGSGKNQSIRAIKPLIPKEWYFEFTTSTPEAMKYLPEEFEGTLIIYEALGVRGDSGSLSLRAIGEGESIETIYPMRNELTGKMEMGRAKTNAKNFITTSSDIDINPDLYRRVLKTSMNHSTELTKKVMQKKIHDAAYPDSLKATLELEEQLPFAVEDFQNALRLIDWKLEVVAFTPDELLNILDLAVKIEQEVALRTHIEKIVNFTRVLALLNQKQRLHVRIAETEYVIAEPQDFKAALQILDASIKETVSRIEKRQEEALRLFTEDVSLTKNDVASKLKVSTRTAQRVLRTLSQAGYLQEDDSSKLHRYELLEKEPEYHALQEMARSIEIFHQNSLKTWLNTIATTGKAKQRPASFCVNGSWSPTPPTILETNAEVAELVELDDIETDSKEVADAIEKTQPSPSQTVLIQLSQNSQTSDPSTACHDVTMPTKPETSSNLPETQIHHANPSGSRCPCLNQKNNTKQPPLTLDQILSASWVETGCEWQTCTVCGNVKFTSCQAQPFKGDRMWLCEDCYDKWARQRGIR